MVILLVPPTRFERAAYGLGIHCSILLSYGGTYWRIFLFPDWYKLFWISFYIAFNNPCQHSSLGNSSTLDVPDNKKPHFPWALMEGLWKNEVILTTAHFALPPNRYHIKKSILFPVLPVSWPTHHQSIFSIPA